MSAAAPRRLAASKRMRLSRPGELRALLRMLDWHNDTAWADIKPRIEEVLMSTIEVTEQLLIIGDSDPVYLDLDIYRLLRESALGRMEQALVEANAAYNDGTNTHSQIRDLLHALHTAHEYATVVYTLTDMPEGEDE